MLWDLESLRKVLIASYRKGLLERVEVVRLKLSPLSTLLPPLPAPLKTKAAVNNLWGS